MEENKNENSQETENKNQNSEIQDIEMEKKFEELKRVIEEYNKPAETNLLNDLKFKTEECKYLFDKLPLSDYEKEQMIIELYNL